MKFVARIVIIVSLLAITEAQRTRSSNRRRDGLNFSDLIPSTQRNKSPYATRRAESPEETPPELAQFSDLIPAEQIGDDIPISSQKQINNNAEEADSMKPDFQESFDDYADAENAAVEPKQVVNDEEVISPKFEDDNSYRSGYYGIRHHHYPKKYYTRYSKPRKYGFPSSAASNFVDNFRDNANWEELRSRGKPLRRSKRSHLSHLSHRVLPLPHDLPPTVAHDSLHREAVLAAMLQQRLLHEEHRKPHHVDNHHFVEVASKDHHVSHGWG